MAEVKLAAASGGGSISIKGPSSSGSDVDVLDTSGNLTISGTSAFSDNITLSKAAIPTVLVQNSTDTSYSTVKLQQSSGSGGYFAITKLGTNSSATGGANAAQVWQSANAPIVFAANNSEKARIEANGNFTTTGADYTNRTVAGFTARAGDSVSITRATGSPIEVNRQNDDGALMQFYQANSAEGNISVSGSTVSYNGGHLSRWSQIKGLSQTDKSARPTIYQGTVMSNLDDLCEWEGEENQQLNMTKISDVDGDKDVAGVFWAWDDDDDKIVNDFYVAMTGDMVIRVAASTTVARGNLLISAGDGTAKPQADDIVRSSTIAKIISTNSTATYEDGSKAYPCVLMAC